MNRNVYWIFCLSIANYIPVKLSAQRNVTKVCSTEYYDFYNNIPVKDSTKITPLWNIPANKKILLDTGAIFADTFFIDADKLFFLEQIESAGLFKWKKGMIRNTAILKKKKSLHIFQRKNKKARIKRMKKYLKKFKPNAKYSIPVFTMDKKYCVVYKSWSCGSLCGSGGTRLYRLENGKWFFVKNYSFWIS